MPRCIYAPADELSTLRLMVILRAHFESEYHLVEPVQQVASEETAELVERHDTYLCAY